MNSLETVILDHRAQQFHLLLLDACDFIEKLNMAAGDLIVANWFSQERSQVSSKVILRDEVPVCYVDDSLSWLPAGAVPLDHDDVGKLAKKEEAEERLDRDR